jgi:hypothetical protein
MTVVMEAVLEPTQPGRGQALILEHCAALERLSDARLPAIDRLQDTLDYAAVARVIEETLETRHFNLIESAAEAVLARELATALAQGGLLLGEGVAACGKRPGAPDQLVGVDQLGLVGVDQPLALAIRLREPALEPLQLGGEQLVVRLWAARDQRSLA